MAGHAFRMEEVKNDIKILTGKFTGKGHVGKHSQRGQF